MEKFWFVWHDGGGPPCLKHETQEKALAEAERLSKSLPGHSFYVLEAKICVEGIVTLQRTTL